MEMQNKINYIDKKNISKILTIKILQFHQNSIKEFCKSKVSLNNLKKYRKMKSRKKVN
jgi:hypothetical protein